jgi:purine nucleoside permease
LGWDYDSKERHSINGRELPQDWNNDNEKVFMLAAERRAHREREGDI